VKGLLGDFAGVVMCDGYASYPAFVKAREGPGTLVLANCRVGGDVAAPAPHRSGRAGFPHPVPHGIDSLVAA